MRRTATLWALCVVLLAGCADELGSAGLGGSQLPLMRTLPVTSFPRAVSVEAVGGAWTPTGVVLDAGTPARIWVEPGPGPGDGGGDVARLAGEAPGSLAPLAPAGALLLRQGDRIWTLEEGLALYAPDAGELELGRNGGGGGRVTIAWGTPAAPHRAGLDRVAVFDPIDAVDLLTIDGEAARIGEHFFVGDFPPGARLRISATEIPPAHLAGVDGLSPRALHDPGPASRLLPEEPAPSLPFPGLWPEGLVYRVDGRLAGHLPAGATLHLPEGGVLELAANGAEVGALEVAVDQLPDLGCELATLPWAAFTDARASTAVGPHQILADTGVEVGAGDVIRVEVTGWIRDLRGPEGLLDVPAGGRLVRAPPGEGWAWPGGRQLAPYLRIGGHPVAVGPDGVVVAPTSGPLWVGLNGCGAATGACGDALAAASGQLRFTLGVARVDRG